MESIILEKYQKVDEGDDFDVFYWQKLGDQAIFTAAYELLLDYYLIKENYANEPRLQRTVENFQRL